MDYIKNCLYDFIGDSLFLYIIEKWSKVSANVEYGLLLDIKFNIKANSEYKNPTIGCIYYEVLNVPHVYMN